MAGEATAQFWKLPTAIAARADLPWTAKGVLAYLADRQGRNGSCWPGVRRIGRDCGLSVGAVLRAIALLESLGLIAIDRSSEKTARKCNRYRIRNGSATETVALPRREQSATEMVAPSATETVAYSDPGIQTHIRPTSARTRRKRRSEPHTPSISWSRESAWNGITDQDRAEWAVAYPACDLDRELAAASAWLRANPTKAVKRQWRRFLTNWLARSQERGGAGVRSSVRPDTRPVVRNKWGRTPEEDDAYLQRQVDEINAKEAAELAAKNVLHGLRACL